MSLYQLINRQLSQAGFHYEEEQLTQLDIMEYIVFESAGVLPLLQDKSLKCIFRPGHSSNVFFPVGQKVSTIKFGLKDVVFNMNELSMNKDEQINFSLIANAIADKFPESVVDETHQIYNHYNTLCAVIIPDQHIEKAIQSSSLFVAAGNLSEFDLESLLLLRKKLNLYKIADNNLSDLVDRLLIRVKTHISEHYDLPIVHQALPKVEKKFAAILAIRREEYKYNQLLRELKHKLHELVHKGTVTYESPFPDERPVWNDEFDPNYLSVAPIAQLLKTTLSESGADFFNNPISQKSFEHFKEKCHSAITSAKDNFANFRGRGRWYNELNPILKAIIVCVKAIAGIIAGLTVIPGVLTAIYSEQGYIGTFFNTKTDSLRKLETFEHDLFSKKGIFDELNKEIPHTGMVI
ncbi:hypothetical protein OQJ26_13745 [Legionella sp. PATHC038]|uniref:hypothetical protein n=1 Tax=Legionella sheltonii TaxID=2992041 RepID=UPI00224382E3|nr:hypothetical protein [Legionella sp. PATHC038]MCW8399851.1 hypothetical protein [Legionella sp. PATHC038]